MSLKNSYCGTIPKHFDICPSSSKLLENLCNVNNIFISNFVELESLFLLQEKLYLCGKQDKSTTLNIMKDIHSRLRYLFSDSQLSHHQSHLDVITHTNVEGTSITILNDKIKGMVSLELEQEELCKSLDSCNKYIKQLIR